MKMFLKNNGILLSFLSLILMGFVSCKGISKPKNDLDKENLKGDVILVDNGNEVTFYNQEGLKKKYSDYLNKIIESYTYINNKLSSSTSRSETSKDESKTIYYYSEKGILDSLEFNSNSLKTKEYYTNDFNGNVIIDSVVSNSSFMGNSIIKYTYNGNIIESETRYGKYSSYIKKYSNNNPTEFILYTVDNNGGRKISSTTTYQYSYDAQGNWIEQKSFVDGKEDKVVKRTVMYKGQDISQYEKKYNDLIASINNSPSEDKTQTFNNNNNSNSTTIIAGGGDKNNNNNNNQTQREVKQWINCRDCNGKGIIQCLDCNGRGSMKCTYCYGKGWKWSMSNTKETCNTCGGSGDEKCERCNGRGNRGTCLKCGGRGQVQQ